MASKGAVRRERRRHGRAKIHLEAFLQGDRPENDLRLTVLNFSVGGFFCETSRPIKPMTCLGVTFQFPPYAEHPPCMIEARAVVVRSEPPAEGKTGHRMAACFTQLSEEAKEHIQGYVNWYTLVYGGETQVA